MKKYTITLLLINKFLTQMIINHRTYSFDMRLRYLAFLVLRVREVQTPG